ncbi:ADP-ribosylation factor-like protein 6-interacting protein 6 [Sphaeramia orbicularis]|uniref:ADP-ribosylation factor-like protein 6-interacting protein 6 n=1 Tax=Sphaeramia orbicularis TaxID=375764 RepID=A0A673AJQ1_9TELE|nr:ADP-ribosylation factor-like protein 6-interacting protein 6 [Sphaeramia orbicularis]
MPQTASDGASGDGFHGRLQETAAPSVGQSVSKPRPFVFLVSVVGSAVAVAAVGCFCALLYPILKELRAERVRGQDGTEQRILGFWSILVLSLLVGYICCVLWWTLAYLDSYRPGSGFQNPLTLTHFRDSSGHGFHLDYGMAVLNGVMATLTVIWSLT